MEHRLDVRLLQLPRPSLHALARKLGAADEFRGWWSREEDRLGARERAAAVVDEALDALARVDAFGPEDGREPGGSVSSGPGAAARAAYGPALKTVLLDHEVLEFGEDLFRRLHARLLAPSPDGRRAPGLYRTPTSRTGVAEHRKAYPNAVAPIAAHLVATEMGHLTEWTRTRLADSPFHPLLVSAAFLLEFLSIQPFADGNARLGRLLGQLLLLQCGYAQVASVSLDAVIAGRWTQYHLALRQGHAGRRAPVPDISPWLDTFLDVLLEHGARARRRAERRPDDSTLSTNQIGALRLLDRHGEITNRALCEELGLPRDTAKQVLKRLVVLGRIEPAGAGRAARYRRASRVRP